MRIGIQILTGEEQDQHDFHQETEICNVTEQTKSWCTLENVACWGRHYPAPYDDEADHETAISNEAESELGNCMFVAGEKTCWSWLNTNPIRTKVGVEGGLSEHELVNGTLSGHILHDPNSPSDCPKPLNKDKDWMTSTPNGCSQTHRVPHLENGKITMRTRGFGSGPYADFNDEQGPLIFKDLDGAMKKAMSSKTDKLCPSLPVED